VLELITRVELSKKVGVSRQAISKAIKNKRLRLLGEGRSAKIDLHDHLTVNYMKDNSSNRQVGKEIRRGSGKLKEEVKKESDENNQNTDLAGESVQLRDEKIRLQTKKLQIEMAEKLGQLISRKEVEVAFSKLSGSIVNYIFPLGDRISPLMAGVFKTTDQDMIHKSKVLLDQEIGRALEAIKKDVNDLLSEI